MAIVDPDVDLLAAGPLSVDDEGAIGLVPVR